MLGSLKGGRPAPNFHTRYCDRCKEVVPTSEWRTHPTSNGGLALVHEGDCRQTLRGERFRCEFAVPIRATMR